MDSAHLIEALKSPDVYPEPIGEVEFLQTHISYLFFAGDRVYKIKRPVQLDFLDYSTLERRRHFCDEEVRLNRRLAPRVYLGVAAVVRSGDGRLRIRTEGAERPEGEIVEWAVEMLRLPTEGMLYRRLENGEFDDRQTAALANLLVRFHAEAPTGDEVDEYGTFEAVEKEILENLEQIERFVAKPENETENAVLSPRLGSFLQARARSFLREHRGLFDRRVSEGWIREGHGDLHAGNICITDGDIVIYDCIEFNRLFRCLDVAGDLAFLVMDLDYRGYVETADDLVRRYAELACDPELYDVMDFHKSHRAVVKAKVASLTAADPEADAERSAEQRSEARRYFQLAASYHLPPVLILTCGLPATGKSRVARHIARALRAKVLRSDVERKRQAGLAPTERGGAALYSRETTEATYDRLLEKATAELRSSRSVIVDATFSRRSLREPFLSAAARAGHPVCLLHVTAPEEVVRDRLELRAREADRVSDADFDVYLRARDVFEPPLEIPPRTRVEVRSGRDTSEEASAAVIERLIDAAGVDAATASSRET